MNDKTMFETGMQTRREVLGAEHVDRSLAQASDFSRPLQELVTEYCWGTVWSRPGLDRRTRSLINIAMLTALGRRHELTIHVRGALTNGVTPEEIQEALLQTAIYCGVPAAMDAQRTAEAVLIEQEAIAGGNGRGDTA
ncbi:MAG: 4-carboxymuconolactone decarboxylase [Solirubrobacterales bacterium]|nr:4-carboxymuconolactone decarboxylase [Solirubrobacterales bacterium]MBV9714028.1 4-carboxymuconolactone decarboxylase [Solirubrobacterales bacterium]